MDGLKRYVNDDRFRVDGDKNVRLLAFAFTIVFVWTGPQCIKRCSYHDIYVSIGVIVLCSCKANVLPPTLLSDLGVGLLRFLVSYFSCASLSLITLVDNISIEPCG